MEPIKLIKMFKLGIQFSNIQSSHYLFVYSFKFTKSTNVHVNNFILTILILLSFK